MRILVLDPQPVVREGLRSGLSASGEFFIVGSCGDVRSAAKLVDSLAPEVVVMDLDVGPGDGASSVRELRRRLTAGGVVVFAPRPCWRILGAARRAGAAGVVLKTDPLDILAHAVRVVGQGETYLSRSLPQELRESIDRTPDVLGLLSERECEVFYLVIRGLTNRRIGRELFISPKTVDSHRGRILDKLGCRSAVELVRFAYLNRLVPEAERPNEVTEELIGEQTESPSAPPSLEQS